MFTLRRGSMVGLMVLLMLWVAACAPASSGEVEQQQWSERSREVREEDHSNSARRIDGGDASITLLTPAAGTVYDRAEEILIEVEVTGFALGEEGNHWHIYVRKMQHSGLIDDLLYKDLCRSSILE